MAAHSPPRWKHLNVRLNRILTDAAKSAQKVKHAGIRNSGPVMDAVIDLSTDMANATLHPGTNARVLGARIKIEGEPLQVGVSLANEAGAVTKLATSAISVNHPKTITFIVPALPPVTTQFTGEEPAKIPHTCFFPAALTVPAP